jgi:hypothetical protein
VTPVFSPELTPLFAPKVLAWELHLV